MNRGFNGKIRSVWRAQSNKKNGEIVCKSGVFQAAFDDTREGYHQNQSSGVFANQAMESTKVKSSHCVSPAVAAWLQEVVVPMGRGRLLVVIQQTKEEYHVAMGLEF